MPHSRRAVTAPEDFDSDLFTQAAVAVRLQTQQIEAEYPTHHHRKGQLILALHGAVTCRVPQAWSLVPPQHAIWIPGGTLHTSQATTNARIVFLFIEPGAVEMPARCCTLAITPLVRELIQHLADQNPNYSQAEPTARIVDVLLEQLAGASVEQLHLPISDHPKIKRMLDVLSADPGDRTTLLQWSERLAMSQRSLARLIERTTGLTFGKWRQQLHLIVALSQLAEGQAVQRVAGNLGYESVTAFITMFKKALGKSPTQYFASLKK